MSKLFAHLRALEIWVFLGGWQRLFLFLTTIPILWMFWGICSPSLVSGGIDLKIIFLSHFTAWYSLSYLQNFTNSDSTLGLSGIFHLPTCPALPISPLMRIVAELIFFFIISILVFIPLFALHLFMTLPLGKYDLSAAGFILSSIQGTLAIAPIVFCLRMNVNGTLILPATLRMALPVMLCGAFCLFQMAGLFTSWLMSIVLFAGQITILCAIFIWFRGQNDWINSKVWAKFFSRYILDDSLLCLLLGKSECRNARNINFQIAMDLTKIIILYIAYWICFYFPLMGALYYLFINLLHKPVMNWFFFLLLLILPSQDSHALAERFIIPILSLPVRQDKVLQWFYLLFSVGIAAIWTIAFIIVSILYDLNGISVFPAILIFSPTIAGIWVNRILNKPSLTFTGIAILCSFPIGYYFNLFEQFPTMFFLCALAGSLLPYGSMPSFRQIA